MDLSAQGVARADPYIEELEVCVSLQHTPGGESLTPMSKISKVQRC